MLVVSDMGVTFWVVQSSGLEGGRLDPVA